MIAQRLLKSRRTNRFFELWTSSALFVVVLCLVASCTEMKSRYPAGEPVPLFEGYKHGVSIWQHDESVYFVKPLDDYRASIASLAWDETLGAFKPVQIQAVVGQLGEVILLNYRELQPGTDEQYSIMRLAGAEDEIVLFQANSKQLAQDIKAGRIKVLQPDNHTYEMQMTKAELDTYISENADSLFKFDGVSILSPITAVPLTFTAAPFDRYSAIPCSPDHLSTVPSDHAFQID